MVLRVDLLPVVDLEVPDALPAGLPRGFFSVVDLPLAPADSSFFLRPVELLARGVLVLGVRFAGDFFPGDDLPPLER